MYRKYQINENFFDEINTQEKAYFLGILFADGYNNYDKSNVRLSLQEGDVQILNDLKELLYVNNDKPLGRSKKENCNDLLYLDLTNKHISNKLKELGMIQNKTFFITFPEIPHNLYNHFIRGYFDGDGYIGTVINEKGHFKDKVSIVGTESFVNSLNNIFKERLNINCSIETRHPERNNNIRTLTISGRLQVIKLMDYLYNNSNLKLKRKYDRYKQIKRRYK